MKCAYMHYVTIHHPLSSYSGLLAHYYVVAISSHRFLPDNYKLGSESDY